MHRNARFSLAVVLALQTAASAAVIKSAPVSGGQNSVIPIVPAQLGSGSGLGLSPIGSGLSLTPSLSGSLSAPSVNGHVQVSALPAPILNLPQMALPRTGIPALTPLAPLLQAAPLQAPAARNPGKTSLERLSADMPGAKPQASDLIGAKDHADKTFSFKLGDSEASFGVDAGQGPSKSKGGGKDAAVPGDDGGGPNVPHRDVEYKGKVYPSVVFRPNTSIEPLIIQAIDASQKTLRIALYEFKLRGVLEALQRARRRGVDIQIILDYTNVFPYTAPGDDYIKRRSNEVWALLRDGFKVSVLRGDGEFGIMHNKFVVVDGGLAEFGSYNWSWAAEHAHYENAKFTTDAKDVKAMEKYWEYLRGLAKEPAEAKDYKWPRELPAPPAEAKPSIDFNGVKLPSYTFSPNKVFEDNMVAALNASKKSVDIAVFALRSTRIAEAILKAKQRGLKIRVIIDRSQHDSDAFGAYTRWLAANGIEVRILAGPNPDSDFQVAEKTHHKVAIFDGKLVEMGSPNFTKYAAVNNFENGHFLDDKTDVAGYQFVYEHMWKIAEPFKGPATSPALPTDEELTREAAKDPTPRVPNPKPDPGPLPPVNEITYNGIKLPSSAMLPEVPIEPMIVQAIDATKRSLKLALYEFNLEDVLGALRRAKKRGVKIEIVIDRAHVYTLGKDHKGDPKKPSAQIQALIAEGFDVMLLKGQSSGIMHNKAIVYDDKLVMSGSYNLTDAAEHNHFENVTFSNKLDEVKDMAAYYQYLRGAAEPVDETKFEEVLNRVAGMDDSSLEKADTEGRKAAEPDEDGRKSKFPEPPQSKATPVKLNGETFRRYYFSPQGGIEAALVAAIHAAKASIDVAMFSFYSKTIADALLEAKNRGVNVRLVLDNSQSKLAKLDDWFAFHGFDIVLIAGPNDAEGDPMYEKMHNKFMIVDGSVLINGSFNYSPNAEKNSFEHVKFIDDKLDVARFVAGFVRMHARGWKPKAPKTEPDFGAAKHSESYASDFSNDSPY